ncbi:MAG: HPr family phosphocarrier protein [Burkholderiales bacterium]|nr:HPr family phosphocarrier protein [Burkholderiales bacterium]
MLNRNVQIINKLGLHARASSKLVELVNQFHCEIWLDKENKHANAKSIMSVMMLSASKGSLLSITTNGPDEEIAMEKVLELITNKFGENE